MPVWQRWLCAILFAAGGGGFAAWGMHDLAAWLNALRTAAPVVETASTLLGLVPLGTGVALVGAFFLITELRPGRQQRIVTLLVGVTFALMIVGVALAVLGGPAIGAVMRSRGYHACEVHRYTRTSFTTWAARDLPCPPADR